jgi:hypothetical protein
MSTTIKTLADLRPGDKVAFFARPGGMAHRRTVTSVGGGIMLDAIGRNPEFDSETGKVKPFTPGNRSFITVVTPEIEAEWEERRNRDMMRHMADRLPACIVAEIVRRYENA